MKLFRKAKLNSKGFSHVEAVVAILVIAGIAAIGVRVISGSHAATPPNLTFNSNYKIYTSNGTSAPTKIGNDYSGASSSYLASTYYNNGSKIAYIESPDQIYKYDTSTKTSSLLATAPVTVGGQVQTLAWSESAQKFYEMSSKIKTTTSGAVIVDKLVTFNAKGTSIKTLYSPGSNVFVNVGPWSPDGTKIPINTANYTTHATFNGYINIATGALVSVPSMNGSCTENFSMSWSSDSQSVYCATGNSIIKVNITSGTQQSIISSPSNSVEILKLSLSPNNNYLAYATESTTGNGCTVYIDNLSTNSTIKVASEPSNDTCYELSWSPNNSMIAFTTDDTSSTSPSQLFTVTSSGKNLASIFTTSKQNSTQYSDVYGLNWSVQ